MLWQEIGEFVQTLDNIDRILSSVWLLEHMMTSSLWWHHHYGVNITTMSSWTLAGCYHTVNSCLQMALKS